MIDLKYDTEFFGSSILTNLRYITGWDNAFQPAHDTGELLFYSGNPKLIVQINSRNNQIIIHVGKHNDAEKVKQIVADNEHKIYNLCQNTTYVTNVFCLDLEKMVVMNRNVFTERLPVRGLNTFFVFSAVKDENVYCLFNATPSFKDTEFMAWYLSYIYSLICCTYPKENVTDEGKVFLQMLSSMVVYKGDENNILYTSNKSILNCGLGSTGWSSFLAPGKTDRLNFLSTKLKARLSTERKRS